MRWISKFAAVSLIATPALLADDLPNTPRPIPLTRPEMKTLLEDMKGRQPRIPLPELTATDREKLGDRADNYESRLRYHYLPGGDVAATGRSPGSSGFGFGGFGRENDPDMSLDYAFKTQLFWIVSRTNNCQYCLGHQESKLLGAGMTEDEIAALDGDWSQHTPAQRAAYAFARKITYEPHRLNDVDIDGLRLHFKDKQILEMTLSVAGNNSINRWKEGAGIPQSSNGGNFGNRRPGETTSKETSNRPAADAKHSYLTPTSPRFQNLITKVAPLAIDSQTGKPIPSPIANRPPLESRTETEKALAIAKNRAPRLPLATEAQTKELLPEGFPSNALPQWTRLLATFPHSAQARITSIQSADERGELKPLLKAQISWIIARQDRAWYAAGQAKHRLNQLGWSDDQVFSLDGDWAKFSPAERSLFRLARQLAATPVVLTDADVAEALKHNSPRDVVQAISYTTNRASFDRITEAAGLPIDN